jgi:hypothetical protein
MTAIILANNRHNSGPSAPALVNATGLYRARQVVVQKVGGGIHTVDI